MSWPAVVPEFEERPLWAKKGRFLKETHMQPALLFAAATNNVLVKKEVFDTVGLFEPRFALTVVLILSSSCE